MDQGIATLLAGGIPAAVAALTFAATQVWARLDARRSALVAAIGAVLGALEAVPRHLVKSRIVRAVSEAPELELVSAITRIVAVIPRRHSLLWEYLSARTVDLSNAAGDRRVELSAEMGAVLISYLRAPRKTIEWLPSKIAKERVTLLGEMP